MILILLLVSTVSGESAPPLRLDSAIRIASCGPSEDDQVMLDRAMHGPSYDHLGGGFHDRPGGPKRLETNAWFLNALVRSYEGGQDLFVRNVALDVVAFALRDLKDAAGAFFRAQGDENSSKYFAFTEAEVRSALGQGKSSEFFEHFALSPDGFPVLTGSPFGGLAETRQTLVLRRLRRVRLPLDETIDEGGNGVWIGALARAAHVFGRHDFLEAARRASRAARGQGPARSGGAAFGLASLARLDQSETSAEDASKALDAAIERSPQATASDLTLLVWSLTDALRVNRSDLRLRQLAHMMREVERRFPNSDTLAAARCLNASVTAKAP